MSRILSQLTWRRERVSQAAELHTQPKPAETFIAFGDVHGCCDLMCRLALLVEEKYFGCIVVFLGDYVDRGEQTKEVLKLLINTSDVGPNPAVCLMGNHERLLLDFIDDPVGSASFWLRHGGLQTLASFGVSLPSGGLDNPLELEKLGKNLKAAMGQEMIGWLRNLPLTWQSGNVWAVHGGANPLKPMSAQSERSLLWGHADFLTKPRQDGQWIIHGHTVVDAPEIGDGRIAVDTGAYATGTLSAAVVSSEGISFMQTRSRLPSD